MLVRILHTTTRRTIIALQIAHVAQKLLGIILLSCVVKIAPSSGTSFQDRLNQAGIEYRVPPTGKAILVNIPAFELMLFVDGLPVMRSRVIAGAPWHRTPRVKTYVSSVRFRPTWRPTGSMVASGEYRDRVWPPGEDNPLGLAAVRLEPGLLVYLHDTNRRHLFNEKNRALSHGCIRVEDWAALVAFVLDMDITEVHRLANGRRTVDAPAPPIPVELGYYTRFPDATGRIITYPDIYGLHSSSVMLKEEPVQKTLACAETLPVN